MESGEVVMLIKPQFEAGRAGEQRGVVRDAKIHRQSAGRIWPKPKNWALACGISIFPGAGSPRQHRIPGPRFFRGPAREFAPPSPEYTVKKPMSILRKTSNPRFCNAN